MEYLIILLNFSAYISMGNVLFVGSVDNFGMNTNDEILQEEDILVVYTIMMMVACNTHNLLNPNELEEGGQLTMY